ncbi:MAG: rRNA maturation RNase YbeY [Bacteroidales bacterium]
MILYYNEGCEMPSIKKQEVNNWIKEVAALYDRKVGNISYIFCNDEKILEINREYLQHDYYTDIITFDYTENNKIGGDIFISVDTVMSNSEEFKTDYIEELHRIIIHGILHLCGIKDKEPEERADMTRRENEALALRNKKDA